MDADTFRVESMNTNLTDEQYQAVLARLQNLDSVKLLHAVMGIVTEAGELMDALKKHFIYGKALDRVNVLEEGGDLEWYIALLLTVLNSRHGEIFTVNVAKLRARYPNKFTEFDALNRNLGGERKILEDGHGAD